MEELVIEGDNLVVSDGYHTFDTLYDHRNYLLLALMQAHPEISWRSRSDSEGNFLDDWFIAGMRTPFGGVIYHLKYGLWAVLDRSGIETLPKAEWDGHTSEDALKRIMAWVIEGGKKTNEQTNQEESDGLREDRIHL